MAQRNSSTARGDHDCGQGGAGDRGRAPTPRVDGARAKGPGGIDRPPRRSANTECRRNHPPPHDHAGVFGGRFQPIGALGRDGEPMEFAPVGRRLLGRIGCCSGCRIRIGGDGLRRRRFVAHTGFSVRSGGFQAALWQHSRAANRELRYVLPRRCDGPNCPRRRSTSRRLDRPASGRLHLVAVCWATFGRACVGRCRRSPSRHHPTDGRRAAVSCHRLGYAVRTSGSGRSWCQPH